MKEAFDKNSIYRRTMQQITQTSGPKRQKPGERIPLKIEKFWWNSSISQLPSDMILSLLLIYQQKIRTQVQD